MYKLQTTLPAVHGGADFAILTGKSDIFPYENGKKVSDVSMGVKLTLALQNNRLSQLTVKFDHDPLPKVSDQDIINATASCNFLYVQIPDCKVDLFSTNSGLGMSATASSAQIVSFQK